MPHGDGGGGGGFVARILPARHRWTSPLCCLDRSSTLFLLSCCYTTHSFASKASHRVLLDFISSDEPITRQSGVVGVWWLVADHD